MRSTTRPPTGSTKCFVPRGVVDDVGRRIGGRAAIREWTENEVVGGRMKVIRRVARPENPEGLTFLVPFTPAGGDAFLAHYRFVTRNDRIVMLELTHAKEAA
jgi:hypothetical protein